MVDPKKERSGSFMAALIAGALQGVFRLEESTMHELVTWTTLSKAVDRNYEKWGQLAEANRFGLLIVNHRDEAVLIDSTARGLLAAGEHVRLPCKLSDLLAAPLREFLSNNTSTDGECLHDGRVLKIRRFVVENMGAECSIYFVQDQTQWQQFMEEIKSYRDFSLDLKTIFDAAFDVIYVSDGQGKTLRVSSACERLWGLREEELVGKNVRELESEGVFNPSITRLVLEQKKQVSSFQTTKNGRRLYVVGTPIFGQQGEIIRVVNASRDVTELDMLQKEIENVKALAQRYQQELMELRSKDYQSENIIFRSNTMKQLMSFVYKIAPVDSTVVISGASGVGKEVIAREIHKLSGRRSKPFIKINCGAIPEALLESELFGYDKGAFTGAKYTGKPGLIELADTGTLFLDEIAELPLALQVKLLQVIQEREFMRIGGTHPIRVDIRIIAATNQNLWKLVEEGRFREDMYYRLNVVNLAIPPLRERTDDIIPLAQHFLQRLNKKYFQAKQFLPEALDAFLAYRWPGNVRELENTVERLVVTVEPRKIGTGHLPENIKVQRDLGCERRFDGDEIMPLKEALATVERNLLQLAMKRYRTTSAAAKALGVSQSTISRKLQNLANK